MTTFIMKNFFQILNLWKSNIQKTAYYKFMGSQALCLATHFFTFMLYFSQRGERNDKIWI